MRTIAAQDATVGASYKNARGSRLTVTEIPPDPAQVSVRLESGTVTSVPRAYPLELTDAPPAPETVAHGAIDAIRAAATTWEVEDLEDLADLDHRPEVQDLIRQELGKRQPPPAPEDPIANPWGVPADFHAPKPTEVVATLTMDLALECAVCSARAPAMISTSGGPARVGVHANPATGVYCAGSALPPKAPTPEAPPEAFGAGWKAYQSGRYGSLSEAQADPANRDWEAEPYEAGWTEAETANANAPTATADALCASGAHAADLAGKCINCGVVVPRAGNRTLVPTAPDPAAEAIRPFEDMLGKAADAVIAGVAGVSIAAVVQRRKALGVLEAPELPEAEPAPTVKAPETPSGEAAIPKDAASRIKLIRDFTTLEQVEAARSWPNYQAPSLDPELKAQGGRLADVAAHARAGNVEALQVIAGLKAVRPGVLAMIRKAIAELQGAGKDVVPSARPVDPAELAPRPLTVTPEDHPADLATTLAELVRATKVRAWSTEVVTMIRDVLSNVRDGRAALQLTEDVASLRLAWRLELIGRRRGAILDQLRARVLALGGAPVSQEDLIEWSVTGRIDPKPTPAAVEAEPAPELGAPVVLDAAVLDGKAREPSDPDGDLAEAAGLAAFRAGALVDANPHADPFYREAWEAGWLEAAQQEAEAGHSPERLDALPIPDQVAKATTARALELVAMLTEPEDVDTAIMREEQRPEPRLKVLEALDERGIGLISGTATPPAVEPEAAPVEAEPPPPPKAPPLAFQVQDLQLHQLPDGTEDLWAHVKGHRPARVGQVGDPKIAPVVELYRRHLAELNGKPGTPRAKATEAATSAQAALAAFAAALPALSAMGLDVALTITTRPPRA